MTLGDFIHRNRTAILGLTTLLIGAGLWAAWSMPVAVFPEIAFHRIALLARAGDLPVDQTLTAVTQPLENAVTSVLGVRTIRSLTTRGGAQLDLAFGWNEDMMRSLQLVQAAIDETRSSLPAGTDLEARLLDTSAFPIIGVAVTSEQQSLAEMSDFAIYEAAPQLRTIPGVYRVELNGAKVREYGITVDPTALAQHHIDLATVETAVRASNVVGGSGRVRDGYQLALPVVRGEGAKPKSLLDVVVADETGVPVTLGQVAGVDSILREDFTRAAANGKTAVLIGISRQPTGNAVTISDGVRRRIAALAKRHPEYRFSVYYDQADLVHEAIGSVRDSIAIGLVLAVAVVFFFLADVRTTFIAAAVIPVTVLITCFVLRGLGMTFNLMTLGGIAAGIGLVLDDAIVVVENFHRHRILGQEPRAALSASVSEITHALVGSTLTPVAVLLPLGFLGGVPGAFFRPLAVTMSVALIVSLGLALTFTPALAAAVKSKDGSRSKPAPGDHLAGWLSRFYTRGLHAALVRPWLAVILFAAFILLAGTAYEHVKTGFVPEMDEGAFILDYWSPPGTSLEATLALLARVDHILENTPAVRSFSRRTGAELGFFLTETNRGDYAVRLRHSGRRPIAEIISSVREQVRAQVPGLRVDFVQIMQDMVGDLSGNPNPIEVKLFGTDLRVVQRAARSVNKLIEEIPGIVDNFDGITPVGPTYRIDVDERQVRRAGLTAAAVHQVLRTAVRGTVVGQVLEGDRAIPLRMRYPDSFRYRLDRIGDLVLIAPHGHLAPLRSLAQLSAGREGVQVTRENLRQLVRVTARLSHRDLGSAMRDIQALVRRDLALPPGVTIEYGGLYAGQQRAFAELLIVFLAALACVSALLLIEFGSVAAVVAIVAGSSLALSGSLAGLWATGTALNVSSVVGTIMVVGVVAKNGILLLDFAAREHARTGDLKAALIAAGRVRLRPILMTSMAAIAGLAPLAAGVGAGAQMHQPLAIAILGGVSVSMLFSLIGVPVIYLVFARPKAPEGMHAAAGH